MVLDVGDPQTFLPMAALAGAAVAGIARRSTVLPLLRRAFGSSTSTWLSGWAVAAVIIGGTALLEAIYMDGDEWQYLATILIGYFVVAAWTIAGAVVGVASLLRRHVPAIEPIVHVLLAGAIGVAVALWIWFAAFGIPMASDGGI